MSIYNAFFGKTPEAGQVFCHMDRIACPFDREDYSATVIEVREGWVKFKRKYGADDSMTVRMFRYIYHPMPESKP